MTGTSILMPDALVAQTNVLASLWTPEGLAPLLVSEFVLGVDAPTSVTDHASASGVGFELSNVGSATITNAGSGGTNGAGQALAFSGGGGTGAAGNFTVAGGVVTAVNITAVGNGYTSPPTISTAASAGLTGAIITPVMTKPTYNAHSAVVNTGASNSGPFGFDTGKAASETDQTMVLVLKKPAGNNAGTVFAASPGGSWLGFLHGVSTDNKMMFYNSSSGVSPSVPSIVFPDATNFNVFFGWGSTGGPASIRSCAAGALNAAVVGTSNGATRPAQNVKIGTSNGNGNGLAEIAYAARLPAILTDAQMLAWYLALKNGPLGQAITIA